MKVILPQAYVTLTDLGHPVYVLSFIAPKHFSFILLTNLSILSLMKVISEIRRMH
jgi:hypothetical protein